jgi:hypothetical protein
MIRTVFALAATVMVSGCVTNDRPRMTDAYIQWTCAHIPGETLSWCPGVMATMRQSAIDNRCMDANYTVIKEDCEAPIPRFAPEVVDGYMRWVRSRDGRKYLADNPGAGSIMAAMKMRERCDRGDEVFGMRLVCDENTPANGG